MWPIILSQVNYDDTHRPEQRHSVSVESIRGKKGGGKVKPIISPSLIGLIKRDTGTGRETRGLVLTHIIFPLLESGRLSEMSGSRGSKAHQALAYL